MIIRKLSLIMLSCLVANTFANTTQPTTPLLAGGISTLTTNDGAKSSPLLVYEDKQSWKVASIPANFPKAGNIGVNGITCTDTACLALILDQSTTKGITGHVFISQDKGKSWQNDTHNLNFPPSGEYMFDSINCMDKQCIIVGVSEKNNSHPFFLTSNDAGLNWSYSNPTAEDNLPVLQNKLACNNHLCVSAGNKKIAFNKQIPYLLVNDKTNTQWNHVNNIQNFPSNLNAVEISGTSCSSTGCTVVGFDMFDGDGFPIMITSHDQGTTWSYVTQIDNFPTGSRAVLSNIYCSETTCMAVGGYKINNSMYPLIIRSTDGGYHWSMVNAIKSAVNISNLFDVNCDAVDTHLCVSVGQGDNNFLILTSKDGGASWTSIDTSQFGSGNMLALNSVKCENDHCMAVGFNTGFNADKTGRVQPVLMSSGDDISDWSTGTLKGLPSGMNASSLYLTAK
jgi:photosystem II stability/assembly factor-like uncharacterized protein